MTILSIDFETRATVNLRKTGVYPYAEHPNTGIWCMAWAFDDEEPEVWYPDEVLEALGLYHSDDCFLALGGECDCAYDAEKYDFPARILAHIAAGGEIRAWNAEFERIIWREIMHKRWGFPNPKLEQFVCSAAEAAAMALPRALDQACRVTGAKQQKDEEGYGLMMRMTRPRKVTREEQNGRLIWEKIEWWNVPERIHRLGSYCKQDIRSEHAMTKVTRRLTPLEREHYLEVCRQNDRGIAVDLALVQACREVADEGLARANAALEELTGGEVSKVTNHARLAQWVRDQGVETDGVSKKAVRELLESDLDPVVREVLMLRADAGRSSLAKLDSILECVCGDGRIRGMIMYHGASTGRETGRLVQVHNFPRGEIDNPEQYIDALLRRAYEELDVFHHPIVIISSLLRSTLVAEPQQDLLAGDFSGIEARVVCWVAGQDDALALFAAGEDVYKHFASRMWGIPLKEISKHQRQGGKFAVLGCGFGMGAKTGQRQAKDQYGLELTFAQTKEIVDAYRLTYGKVKAFWTEIDEAAMRAVREAGEVVTFGPLQNLKFVKAGAYLYMILPSRRPLVYAAPKIVEREVPWSTEENVITRPAVEISAVNPKTKQWCRQGMYGGIWTENAVQAIARDLLMEGKLRARDGGYPTVLTVHDELVAEVPRGFGSLEEFQRLLTEAPEWAAGIPIATEGWRGQRYRK